MTQSRAAGETSTIATVVSSPSFPALRAELREAVAAGDPDRARGLIDGFHEQVMAALGAGDRAHLAELGGQAARLQRVVQSAEAAPMETRQALIADLRRISRTIEIAWTGEAMRGSRQEPTTPPQFTVRERVLEALHRADSGPRRPRDLAAILQIDRTQVSRALRQLERAGKVTMAAPSGSQDHRAAYWRAA